MKRRVAHGLAALAAGAALLSACGPASAQAATAWRLDPAATHIHWEFSHFGTSTVRGRFDALSGALDYDPAAGRGEVSIKVETASVSTGLALFDRVIRSADVLDVAAHPQAWFVARRFRFEGEVPVQIDGELTLRGTSRPLTLHARHFACEAPPRRPRRVCGGDFDGELRRSDFGITYALPFAADLVRLRVQVEAIAD